ncbi:MAG TPA: sulfide/dihydroorotate dehydrogenase-like FAD/NAD-binding protein, partial [Firmicutes bacterium]|nr:sulfide/dihydroorotate dehydrogenase-like FAD/NAD-binding protein [Bacillota bacterium]
MRNTILAKEKLSADVCSFIVKHPEIASHYEPGQFVIIRVRDKGERIPLTIVDADPGQGTIRLVVQAVGLTTRLVNEMKEGERLLDLLGPLGQPFHLPEESKRVLFIGGGLGIAPLYPKVKDFRKESHVILGAKDAPHLILQKEMKKAAARLELCTDDGSLGRKGFVTDCMEALFKEGEVYDACVAIGPLPMMKAVVEKNRAMGLPTFVSLNPIMVDGTGMCGGCRFEYDGEVKFACVDGPVFDGFKVNFH